MSKLKLMAALGLMAGLGAPGLGLAPELNPLTPGRIKTKKQPKPRREYTPEQEAEIERLKADRSSPGRKKLKLYMKSIREA